ncbi:MAG TPA: hypothetical protein VGR55_00455 [Candidatus Acidoferrum sp.]|nr:hypothetical protein [Candidatus Acidoferrum sp.]
MRIEGELFSQLLAAFYKRDSALLRFDQARAVAQQADDEWRMLVSVLNNKFAVDIGNTHWVDLTTGEIGPVGNPAVPKEQ